MHDTGIIPFPNRHAAPLRPHANAECAMRCGYHPAAPVREKRHLSLDPLLSLALSLSTHKGVYALLVGSGLSKTAGIPTGWEVMEDLIRKVAALKDEDVQSDAAAWFAKTFGNPPTYPELLKLLAPTAAERQSLLRSYFEPSEEDRANGRKLPTTAHRSIAQLAARGYLRVIVTTNFDRLIEQSLEHAGVHPTVVSSPDDIEGMVPLVHAPCVVVKVHGDYLDTRIRNAAEEVEAFETATNELLDRVFSEFGLVVCGWSADWDGALRDGIIRNTRFRYSTFWMVRGELSERARSVVEKRRAVVIPIVSADGVFAELDGKLAALESMRLADPLTPRLASEEVKRLILASNHIRLHDLVLKEANRVRAQVNRQRFPAGVEPTAELYKQRVEQVEVLSWPLAAMAATGAHWGKVNDEDLWVRCAEHLAKARQEPGSQYETWTALEIYPATIVVYAAGMAAIASRRWSLVMRLLKSVDAASGPAEYPLAYRAAAMITLRFDPAQWLVANGKGTKFKTPGSDWLVRRVHSLMTEIVGPDVNVEDLFDQFEIVAALVAESVGACGVYGRFAWRGSHPGYPNPLADCAREIERLGTDHPFLTAGMCGGDLQALKKAMEAVQARAKKVEWY